jgi:uncharacterized membrane protein YqjE
MSDDLEIPSSTKMRFVAVACGVVSYLHLIAAAVCGHYDLNGFAFAAVVAFLVAGIGCVVCLTMASDAAESEKRERFRAGDR